MASIITTETSAQPEPAESQTEGEENSPFLLQNFKSSQKNNFKYFNNYWKHNYAHVIVFFAGLKSLALEKR